MKLLETETKKVKLDEHMCQVKTEKEMIKMFARTSHPLVDIIIVAH